MFETLWYYMGYDYSENDDNFKKTKENVLGELKTKLSPTEKGVLSSVAPEKASEVMSDSILVSAPARNTPKGVEIKDIKSYKSCNGDLFINEDMVLGKLKELKKPLNYKLGSANELRIVIRKIGSKCGGGYKGYLKSLKKNDHICSLSSIDKDFLQKLRDEKKARKERFALSLINFNKRKVFAEIRKQKETSC